MACSAIPRLFFSGQRILGMWEWKDPVPGCGTDFLGTNGFTIFLSNQIKGPRSFVSGAFKLSPIKYHFLVSLYCNGSLESGFLHGIMYHQCCDCLYLAVVKLRWVAYKHELQMRFTFLHTPHWLNKRFSRRTGLFIARLYPPSN